MMHLSDSEIQEYLDGGAKDPRITGHLKECRLCSEAVGFYRTVYAGLADTGVFPRPAGLPARVTSRLHLRRQGKHRLPSPEVTLAAAGIIAALVVAFAFLDMGPVVEGLSGFGRDLVAYALPSPEAAGGQGSGLRPSLTVVLWGFVVIVCVSTLDRLLSRSVQTP
jgi:hypothetical protein